MLLRNIEMEQAVLGSIFIKEHLVKDMKMLLTANDFTENVHQIIFDAFVKIYEKGVKIDYSIVIDELQKNGFGNEYVDYVLRLTESVPTVESFEHYCSVVLEYSQKRQVNEKVNDILKNIEKNDIEETEQELKDIIKNLNYFNDFTNKVGYTELENYLDDFINDLEQPIDDKNQFKLGFNNLDNIVKLERTNLMIIGADTGVGKSALALHMMLNFLRSGKKPFLVSQEMGKAEITRRLISNMAKVKAQKIKSKELNTEEWEKVLHATQELKQYNTNIYDKGDMNMNLLTTIVSRLKKQGKIDVLIIDYLQLLKARSGVGGGGRAFEIEAISRELKQIAMEFDIPVIALSQFSRSVVNEQGKVREPQKSDLKGSSSIEQDANIILLLHAQEDTSLKNVSYDVRYLDLMVKKNRDGGLGKTHFEFFGDYVAFLETEWDNALRKFVYTKDKNTNKTMGEFEDIS